MDRDRNSNTGKNGNVPDGSHVQRNDGKATFPISPAAPWARTHSIRHRHTDGTQGSRVADRGGRDCFRRPVPNDGELHTPDESLAGGRARH